MAETKYKTKGLDCWNKAKELRLKYYQDYAEAHDRGALRWEGGAWSFDALPQALEGEVYPLTEEPYGASVGADPETQVRYQEAAEGKWGCARDLCAYLRSYWGSIILDEYFFGGKWPKADFIFQDHICCSHGKWLQVVAELEGGQVPYFCFDVGAGPYDQIGERQINYVVEQLYDGIEFLEKTTGRKIVDEKLIQNVYNTYRSACYWSKVCELNQAVPAPLDEKSMYSLYVLGTLQKSSQEIADFYVELYEEVKDRVANQIAAVGNERCRVLGDSQPPWGFLRILRYMEKYGVVSIGSLYTFSLIGWWKVDNNGNLVPYPTLEEQGIAIKDRDHALRLLAEGELRGKLMWAPFYGAKFKNELVKKIARQWKCNAAMIHLNRGCEGTAMHQMELKIALAETGLPVMTYEGNMADEREFDEARDMRLIDLFLAETLGLKKLTE
ncbi:MAG TPA: benzoyl-CoA reductase, bzd-type, subunit O [Dehalococcoidia bacterium]|nr:benzoyl-CoA reductase, bzd-type, subunit O [Dehalococcoidia bacterium]